MINYYMEMPLYFTAEKHYSTIVELLLDFSMDVNIVNLPVLETALYLAYIGGREAIVKVLLK